MRTIFLYLLVFCFATTALSQPSFTANEQVIPYAGPFAYGANLNYYPGWDDLKVADISFGNTSLGLPGIGLDAFRGSLPEHFLEAWGYDIRVSYYQYYQSLGADNHLVFIGYPTEDHRDHTQYCPGTESALFANLYQPIWDGGMNGTPYNELNYYAAYVYKMVSQYKDYVRFWEVWNEPDFAWNTFTAFGQPGQPGNWWENNPPPCDQAMAAPIFHYIRMLRITWEIVKTLDPDSYVCTGGLGNPAFLDAILRNTDNPNDGAVSTDFPLKGGAYFDVLSVHSFPHFDGSLREYVDPIGWVYHRNSDWAAKGITKKITEIENVAASRGYDGNVYQKKLRLVSEMNLPRKSFNPEYWGTNEAQRNYIIKALVEGQREHFEQLYFYLISDEVPEPNAVYEFQTMGLFDNLGGFTYPNYQAHDEAVALKTTSDFLKGKVYDAAMTASLALPLDVDGAAFTKPGDTIFVLWAKTQVDKSEVASANYSFPNAKINDTVVIWQWDYSQTPDSQEVPATDLALTGVPIFMRYKHGRPVLSQNDLEDSAMKGTLSLWPNPASDRLNLDFEEFENGGYELQIIDAAGRNFYDQKLEINNASQTQRVDLTNFPNGLYLLKIRGGDGVLVKRFLVI
ncbi:MAG: T9SS type A sorting domain-containing protein [Bacteroidetes bacterium]|nr:T9SS type A sorting domain-containing protein [Bacteroidota bacterium]